MRVLIVAGLIAAAFAGAAQAQNSHYVHGYYRSNGTYVAPHYQTNRDYSRANNWSTMGNVNPYTGEPGTRPLYPSTSYNGSGMAAPGYGYSQPSYSSPSYMAPSYGYGGRSSPPYGGSIGNLGQPRY
jgi:hypothetical protein